MSILFQAFIILLISGLMLMGAEIFVPGGVLGVMAGLALFAAVIIGFILFGPVYGSAIAGAMLVLLGIVMVLWIRVFPKTRVGRRMTVEGDLSASKGTDAALSQFVNKEGAAVTELRPAGFALIDGKRVDVVSECALIPKGTLVRVVGVEGNRVVVRAVEKPS